MFDEAIDRAADRSVPWWLDVDRVDLEEFDESTQDWSDLLAETATREPGPWLMAGLAALDPSMLSPNDAVIYVQQWERAVAWAIGMQVTATAATFNVLTANATPEGGDDRPFVTAAMAAVAETACALRIAPRTADKRIAQAVDLAGPTEPLRAALIAGQVSASHASAISRELDRLPSAGNPALAQEFADQCAEVLTTVVPFAANHTPGESARKTRMLVSSIDPAAVRERRREAAERQHGVYMSPTEPGTCEITAVMPLAHGHMIMNAINTLATHEDFEVGDGCVTIGQHRVAALVALTLGDPGSIGRVDGPVAEAKITAHLNVVVPLSTMVAANAASGQGGTIGGEAVPADALAEMLAELDPKSTLRRLVTDEAGCIIDAGRARYAISDAQRRIIELRDVHCRFPGCDQPACRCDIDHATSWQDGGCTDLCNLGPLCRRHHQLKTHGKWRIIRSQRNGRCTWRSPLGRIYEHTPPDLLPPPPPPMPVHEAPPPF